MSPAVVLTRISLCAALSLHAATPEVAPEFAWAASGGGMLNDKTRAVGTDLDGNVFLCGEATGDLKFGDVQVNGAAGANFFLTKLDAQGKFLWAKTGGGALVDRGYGVATDKQGNSYVTGHFQSTDADFSGIKLPNRGDYDVFIAKYDRDGKLSWVQTAGGKGYDYGHGIAVDSSGDVVVTGSVTGEAEFGGVKIANESGSHIFCTKYNADGKLVWAKIAGGHASGSGHGVAVDGARNIYVGGLSSGSGEYGGKALVTPKGMSAVVAKISPGGDIMWIHQTLGTPSCLYHEITCDEEGRVWASGMFKGSTTAGQETFTTTGDKDSDALICHLNTDGKLLWSRAGQGHGVDYGLAVATDGRGNSFLTGEFSSIFKLGGEELQSRGSTDIYVASFNEHGSLRWITQAGGTKGDNAYTMVRDSKGHLIFGGSFSGTAQFGQSNVTTGGSNDLYGARMQSR